MCRIVIAQNIQTMTELLPDISEKLDHILAGLPALMPELVLVATFIVSIFSGLFLDRLWRHSSFVFTVLGMVTAGICSGLQLAAPLTENLLFGMVLPDTFGQYIRILILAACLIFAVFVHLNSDFTAHRKRTADLYSILLAIAVGLHLMAIATNWLMVFVSIEFVSIGSYIMVGYLAKEAHQTEAAMKYALFGATCSAIMLYGLSLVYGFTGSLDYTSAQHIEGLAATPPFMVSVALLFVFTGIGFKLSFVPFHFWSPDVYQGAPTPVTAFLSTALKIAGIALLARIFYAWPAHTQPAQSLYPILLVSAIATMLVGNLAALRQRNVKRMMAYSSIGHTGFLMMAVLSYTAGDYGILLFYLTVYALMNMGVFLLVDYIESRTGALDVEDYRGLGKLLPVTFVCFVILLVSLTGLPPTAGFIGKLLIFSAVFSKWQATGDIGMIALLIVGALTTVISLFYYFKVPLNAFLRKQETKTNVTPLNQGLLWLALLITITILLLGIFPYWLVDLL